MRSSRRCASDRTRIGCSVLEASSIQRICGQASDFRRALCSQLTGICMPDAALELLTTRRSFKAVELAGPGPSTTEIDTLLTVASRVPDHGKLTPWRFIVFEGEARRAAC